MRFFAAISSRSSGSSVLASPPWLSSILLNSLIDFFFFWSFFSDCASFSFLSSFLCCRKETNGSACPLSQTLFFGRKWYSMKARSHLSNVSPWIFRNASAAVIPPMITIGGSQISM